MGMPVVISNAAPRSIAFILGYPDEYVRRVRIGAEIIDGSIVISEEDCIAQGLKMEEMIAAVIQEAARATATPAIEAAAKGGG